MPPSPPVCWQTRMLRSSTRLGWLHTPFSCWLFTLPHAAFQYTSWVVAHPIQLLAFTLPPHIGSSMVPPNTGQSLNRTCADIHLASTYFLRSLHPMQASTPTRGSEQLVVICHSEPGAWNTPTPKYETTRCPPDEEPLYGAPPTPPHSLHPNNREYSHELH
jgi:hypothetical protein